MAARMPERMGKARAWLKAEEDRDRKNARVADKLRIALPHELTEVQQMELVRAFAEEVTKGRASWLAAFHAKGKAAHNHHCHLVVRDRDPETGRRVIGLSERDSTEWLREVWEQHANAALAQAGLSVRIDRRTLKAQGIEREAGIHIGPKAKAMAERGARAESKQKVVGNAPGSEQGDRVIDYPGIDQGRTRSERAAEIVDLNAERVRRAERAAEEVVRNQKLAVVAEQLERRLAERGVVDAENEAAAPWMEFLERVAKEQGQKSTDGVGGTFSASNAPISDENSKKADKDQHGESELDYWDAIKTAALAAELEHLKKIHGAQWAEEDASNAESVSDYRQWTKEEAAVTTAFTMRKSLPYRLIYGTSKLGEPNIQGIEGEVPPDLLAGIPADVLADARKIRLTPEQCKAYNCIWATDDKSLVDAAKTAVLFEQVKELLANREKAKQDELEAAKKAAEPPNGGAESRELPPTMSNDPIWYAAKLKADEMVKRWERGETPRRESTPSPKISQSKGSERAVAAKPNITIHLDVRPGEFTRVRVERYGNMPSKPRMVDRDTYNEAFHMEATWFERRVTDAARNLSPDDRREVIEFLMNERIEQVVRRRAIEEEKRLERQHQIAAAADAKRERAEIVAAAKRSRKEAAAETKDQQALRWREKQFKPFEIPAIPTNTSDEQWVAFCEAWERQKAAQPQQQPMPERKPEKNRDFEMEL